MVRAFSAIVVGGALLSAGISGARAANMNQMVHLSAPVHTSTMAIAHASGTAQLMYTTHDVSIIVNARHLPSPTVLHENSYVLWLVSGKHKMKGGHLAQHGSSYTLRSGMLMDVTFTKLVVTAERSMTGTKPMGPTVLCGAVMHH